MFLDNILVLILVVALTTIIDFFYEQSYLHRQPVIRENSHTTSVLTYKKETNSLGGKVYRLLHTPYTLY